MKSGRLTPLLLSILFSSLLSFAALAADGTINPGEMTTVPRSVFQKELTWVLFYAAFPPEHRPAKLFLVQYDTATGAYTTLGLMTDDGVMGDQIAHDGTYTRKIQYKSKKAGMVSFAAVEIPETGLPPDGVAARFQAAPHVQLEVIGRPTFPALLSMVWKKITGASIDQSK